MRQNRWLFTSFTKEMILSLPKLLSLTDLYESFVMWLTVQELLLGIVVYLSKIVEIHASDIKLFFSVECIH